MFLLLHFFGLEELFLPRDVVSKKTPCKEGGGKGRVKSPRGRSAHAPLPNDVTPGKINILHLKMMGLVQMIFRISIG